LKAPSFRSAAAERNLLEVYRTLLINLYNITPHQPNFLNFRYLVF
jgi:hypothetical protein